MDERIFSTFGISGVSDFRDYGARLPFRVKPFGVAAYPWQRMKISAAGENLGNWEFGLRDVNGGERAFPS